MAALLLTWRADPDEFEETEDPKTILQSYTQAELINLITRMLERYPDLERFLERYSPEARASERTVSPERIRREVVTAFRNVGNEWDAGYGLSRDLLDLVRQGDEYAAAGKLADAVAVYHTVAHETLARYGEAPDEEGETLEPVAECVAGLAKCLRAADHPTHRETILRALFDIYAWDVEYGGVGAGDEAPGIILDQARPEERRQVVAWVRERLRAALGASSSREWARRHYGSFLLELEADRLDDEGFLHICREAGLLSRLVDRLLDLGRVDEAIADTRAAGDAAITSLADLFVAHRHADVAERLVRERVASTQDTHLLAWLRQNVAARGDLVGALDLALDLFWRRPNLSDYRQVRDLAQPSGRWESVRADLMARLGEQGQAALLTEIHLDEGEIDQALVTVEQIQDHWGRSAVGPYHQRVAHAAEETRPEAAIRLYLRIVDNLIAQRGRGAYAQAGTYLVHVRELYRRLGQEAVWSELITNLRQQYRQLPALQDEWNKARL